MSQGPFYELWHLRLTSEEAEVNAVIERRPDWFAATGEIALARGAWESQVHWVSFEEPVIWTGVWGPDRNTPSREEQTETGRPRPEMWDYWLEAISADGSLIPSKRYDNSAEAPRSIAGNLLYRESGGLFGGP